MRLFTSNFIVMFLSTRPIMSFMVIRMPMMTV